MEPPEQSLSAANAANLEGAQARLDSSHDSSTDSERQQAEDVSERATYYQTHLDRVSRSFAFCIARLAAPLREQVGLGYLICRIVDTVEDAKWDDQNEQARSFQQFDRFMVQEPSAREVNAWAARIPATIPESERALLHDAHQIFSDFHALHKDVQSAMLGPVLTMSAGMRHFMARAQASGGELRLVSVQDVNRYCFFVAGVVGEMLTQLVNGHLDKANAHLSTNDSLRFGLFLQKINLLKDQIGDEKEGRFLVPNRLAVRASLLMDAKVAFRYLLSVPPQLLGFRLFCAWSFFLGLASLPWIERSFNEASNDPGNSRGGTKIPREEALAFLGSIETAIADDLALTEVFESLTADLEREASPSRNLSDGGKEVGATAREVLELASLYRGSLSQAEILSLFS